MLSFRPDGVLDRRASGGERRMQLVMELRGRPGECARTLQQARDERRVHVSRHLSRPIRRRFHRRRQSIRGQPMGAARREHVGPHANVVEQRKFQRARPCPQLAHGQRRDGLERADEPLQAPGLEPARARTDQFQRQSVNARQSGEFVRGDPWKAPEERRRQIVVDVARGRRDHVKVVEQPFGRWRHRFVSCVVGQNGIDRAQRPGVGAELSQMVAAAAGRRPWRDRQQRRQPPGVLLEQLDAQELHAASHRTGWCERL
jgi:hypothetical protein